MLIQDLLNNRLIVWDIETTGLLINKDKIIQVAAVEVVNGEITRYYEQKVKPVIGEKNGKPILRPINKEALEVHKISLESLENEPVLNDVVNDIKDFFSGATLIAHNGDSFDAPFLDQEFRNIGSDLRLKDFIKGKIDTLFLSRCFESKQKKHSLDAITQRHSSNELFKKIEIKEWNSDKIKVVNPAERFERHDALIDCVLLAKVFLELTNKNVWDLTKLKNFEEKIKPIEFSSFTLPQDYTPVIVNITEEENIKNMSYLEEMEKENKGKVPSLMKEELLKQQGDNKINNYSKPKL